MRSPSPSAGKLSAKEICTLALLGALLFATKAALASLPNVNLNAVIIILSTVFFGWRALYAVGIYILLEGLIFGGNGYMLWWFGYLYTWPLLVAVCMAFRRNDSVFVWAVIAAVFGLVFGPLMYLEYFAINGGWEMFFAMWVSGIPYDLAHCGGNFVFTLALYRPLYRVMEKFLGTPPRREQICEQKNP